MKRKQEQEKQIIRVWRAIPGRPAKYCTVTETGELVRYFESLAAIRAYYKHAIESGAAEIKRELQNTYKPKTAADLLHGSPRKD